MSERCHATAFLRANFRLCCHSERVGVVVRCAFKSNVLSVWAFHVRKESCMCVVFSCGGRTALKCHDKIASFTGFCVGEAMPSASKPLYFCVLLHCALCYKYVN